MHEEIIPGILLDQNDSSISFSLENALSIVNNQTTTSKHCYSQKNFNILLQEKGIEPISIPVNQIQFPVRLSDNAINQSAIKSNNYIAISARDLNALIDTNNLPIVTGRNKKLPYRQLDWGLLEERKTGDIFYSIEYLCYIVNGGQTAIFETSEPKHISSATIRKKVEDFSQQNTHFVTKKIPFNQINFKNPSLKPSRGNNQQKYVHYLLGDAIINHFVDGYQHTLKNRPNFLSKINITPKRQMFSEMFRQATGQNLQVGNVEVDQDTANALDSQIYYTLKKYIKEAQKEVLSADKARSHSERDVQKCTMALHEIKKLITNQPWSGLINPVLQSAILNLLNVS